MSSTGTLCVVEQGTSCWVRTVTSANAKLPEVSLCACRVNKTDRDLWGVVTLTSHPFPVQFHLLSLCRQHSQYTMGEGGGADMEAAGRRAFPLGRARRKGALQREGVAER